MFEVFKHLKLRRHQSHCQIMHDSCWKFSIKITWAPSFRFIIGYLTRRRQRILLLKNCFFSFPFPFSFSTLIHWINFAGRSILPTSISAGYSLDIPQQGCRANANALAWEEVEREGSSHCLGTHSLWRWKHSLYMHRSCKQGKYYGFSSIFFHFC